MFRITRGITLQQGPAFSPIFRFPDGAYLPLYGVDEPDDTPPAAAAAASTDADAAADEPAPSAEAAPATQS